VPSESKLNEHDSGHHHALKQASRGDKEETEPARAGLAAKPLAMRSSFPCALDAASRP
jgi:hypothetical protein